MSIAEVPIQPYYQLFIVRKARLKSLRLVPRVINFNRDGYKLSAQFIIIILNYSNIQSLKASGCINNKRVGEIIFASERLLT